MLSLQMKMVSSLEKCFLDDAMDSKTEKNRFVMFANEKLAFQVMYHADVIDEGIATYSGDLAVSGALAPYAEIRQVANVPPDGLRSLPSGESAIRATHRPSAPSSVAAKRHCGRR